MPVPALEELKDHVAWVIAGISSAFLGYYKLRRVASADKKEFSSNDATSDVIGLLRKEVNRLAEQNISLARIVNELQTEVYKSRRENAELKLALDDLEKWKHGQ